MKKIFSLLISLVFISGCADNTAVQNNLETVVAVPRYQIELQDGSYNRLVFTVDINGKTYIATYLRGHTQGWTIGPEINLPAEEKP